MLINEVAKISGMSKDGIRHYEELGLIKSAPRTAGSRTYRDYDASVVETIEKVRGAQRLGFSLKEIGALLKSYAENPPSTPEMPSCRSFAEEILQQFLGRVEDPLRRIGGNRAHRRRRIWLRTARPTARDRQLIRAIIAATAEPIRAAKRA